MKGAIGAAVLMAITPLGPFNFAMLLATVPLGLPLENTWFAGFVAGVSTVGFFVAAVNSMPEPKEDSSLFYVWLFRFGHNLFHLGTAYAAHPSMWKYFQAEKREQLDADLK